MSSNNHRHHNNHNNKNNNNNKSLEENVRLIWAAALEVWAHQILYIRRVYPQETFTGTTESFPGITTCRLCRHPDVVSYIHDTIQAAVPALLRGVASELSLRIVERDGVTETVAHEWEVYTIRILPQQQQQQLYRKDGVRFPEPTKPVKKELLQQLERGFRNLILKVQALPHGHVVTTKYNQSTSTAAASSSLDQLSFQITVKKVNSVNPDEQSKCSLLLAKGMQDGVWNEWQNPQQQVQQQQIQQQQMPCKTENVVDLTETTTTTSTTPIQTQKQARVLRPLYHLETELCHIDFSMTRRTTAVVVTHESSSHIRP